jgi:choline-sulfatase
MELKNLARDPDFANVCEAFAAEVRQRWDSERIRNDVIATQRQRRAVHAAMEKGLLTSWDHQPSRDAAHEYVRNHMDWTIAAARTRFPPLPPKKAT